jgi:hypothetical protein
VQAHDLNAGVFSFLLCISEAFFFNYRCVKNLQNSWKAETGLMFKIDDRK